MNLQMQNRNTKYEARREEKKDPKENMYKESLCWMIACKIKIK